METQTGRGVHKDVPARHIDRTERLVSSWREGHTRGARAHERLAVRAHGLRVDRRGVEPRLGSGVLALRRGAGYGHCLPQSVRVFFLFFLKNDSVNVIDLL